MICEQGSGMFHDVLDDVVDQIRVATPTHAFEVREKIEKSLGRSAQLEAAGISVPTDDGNVILNCKVRAWYEHDLAERAAWSVAGVIAVENRLTIERGLG
jgi:osmotically-inducible protein OsmY